MKNFAESIRNNVNTVGNNAKVASAFCKKSNFGGSENVDGDGFTRMTAENFLAKIKLKTRFNGKLIIKNRNCLIIKYNHIVFERTFFSEKVAKLIIN